MNRTEKITNNIMKALTVFVAVVTVFVAVTCTVNFGKVIKGCMYEIETNTITTQFEETVEDLVTFDSQQEKEFAMVVNFFLAAASIGLATFMISYTVDKLQDKEFFSE